MPDGYVDAVASPSRTVSIYLTLGTDIDTTAADDITAITGGMLPMSNTAQATDAIYEIHGGLATFEGDGIPTAISNGLIAPPLTATDYPPETGLWSDVISDADGDIDWSFTIALSKSHYSGFRLYTDGPSITAATATFTDGSDSETVDMVCTEDHVTATGGHTFSSITINVTAISRPYSHVRIVECEFGASRSIAGSETTGETVLIDELDPTELSMPMRELDFSLINVDGTYDPDNPDSRLPELGMGYPISLSFTVENEGARYTVPMGRFVIGERQAEDTSVRITAFDARFKLSEISASWGLDTTESLGDTLDELLTTFDVPHNIDEGLFSVEPEASHTFGDDTTILEDLLKVQQAYGVYFLPDRDGTVHVTQTWPTGTALTVPLDGIYAWPAAKQTSRYNFVSVGYTTGGSTLYVEQDLRTDTTETKTVLQISNNPLITTQARASAVLARIAARIKLDTIEIDWIGDPAVDVGDSISMPGKWSQTSPTAYIVGYSETSFDSGLRNIIRGSR